MCIILSIELLFLESLVRLVFMTHGVWGQFYWYLMISEHLPPSYLHLLIVGVDLDSVPTFWYISFIFICVCEFEEHRYPDRLVPQFMWGSITQSSICVGHVYLGKPFIYIMLLLSMYQPWCIYASFVIMTSYFYHVLCHLIFHHVPILLCYM